MSEPSDLPTATFLIVAHDLAAALSIGDTQRAYESAALLTSMSEAIADELNEVNNDGGDPSDDTRLDALQRARARLIPNDASTSCDNHYPNYGSFRGGDPHLFIQDEDSCTAAERIAHFNACRAYDLNPSKKLKPETCLTSEFGVGVNWCCARHLAASK
jgi:hypothetical protein